MVIIINMTGTQNGRVKRFEAFMVVRAGADYVEVHTVGASGIVMDDLAGAIRDLCEGYLCNYPDVDDVEDCLIDQIGNHPDCASGVRISNLDDARSHVAGIAALLREEFETVMEAK